ncbi:MAG: hypothetical protein FWC40_06260 [Proteobacteria bacterium]|nr:hypothetical protein [Pseudomonadota bacterium]
MFAKTLASITSDKSSPEATWNADLADTELDDLPIEDVRRAFALATTLMIAESYTLMTYKVGNMLLMHISSPEPYFMTDNDGGFTGHIGVILGQKPRLVTFPNTELFVQFMKRLRANPDVMQNAKLINFATLLAIGKWHIAITDRDSKTPEKYPAPSWEETDGTLTIRYYEAIHGWSKPLLSSCTLTVAADQSFTSDCKPIE